MIYIALALKIFVITANYKIQIIFMVSILNIIIYILDKIKYVLNIVTLYFNNILV